MAEDPFERLMEEETPDAYWAAVVRSGMVEGLPPERVAEIRQRVWEAFAPDGCRRWALEAFSFYGHDYDELDYLEALRAVRGALPGEFEPEALACEDLDNRRGCRVSFTAEGRRFEVELRSPDWADFNLFWFLNRVLEALGVARRVAFIPKGDEVQDTWTDLMVILPEAYERAVALGVFPWMDVDPFFSERIEWE